MNILLLTPVYPQPDDDPKAGLTPVVHEFTREWAKMGHRVLVMHLPSCYLRPFYSLPRPVLRLMKRYVAFVEPRLCQRQRRSGVNEGVEVYRIPLLKRMPIGAYTRGQIARAFREIADILKEQNFEPHILAGHWENPQIPLLSMLKGAYPHAQAALTLHGVHYLGRKKFAHWAGDLKNIDRFAFRSPAILEKAQALLPVTPRFLCYSGLPDGYIDRYGAAPLPIDAPERRGRFLYVGQFVHRKHALETLRAFAGAFLGGGHSLTLIGDGVQREMLEEEAGRLNVSAQVRFAGRVPREEVIRQMGESFCFTMISEQEAFGLVYLEAMLAGCIVIASRNEGFDGIIQHGVNGFLCEAGNARMLEEMYRCIEAMEGEERSAIAQRAAETARAYRASVMAGRYLDFLCGKTPEGGRDGI